ncbi:MAG: M48 family metallopeptidase [Pirellulales bacterium]|nr:M48 family metallopeptidase [Pirellulales bacterium]
MRSFATADGRLDRPWKKVFQIGLYHLALFLVMISYYAFALAISLWLLGNASILAARIIANFSAQFELESVWNGTLLLGTCVLLWQIVPMLWSQLKGLVTAQHDENDAEALFGIPLSEDRYPEFYAHVASVARQIDAPVPHEIRVTPEPECHAVEVRRFSILSDRRLVLVLGMPHLCVLSRRELDVILAHELSHVRAGDTRMGVFVFRFLESLKAGIELARESRWRWINILYPLSLLYGALMRPLTAPLVRRQELLADAMTAVVFGGELASLTLLKEWQLNHQFHAVVAGYGAAGDADGWTGLFRAFRESWQEFSPEGRAYLLRRLEEEERSGFWDSHPTTGVRIACMRQFSAASKPDQRENDDQELDLENARSLFPDFGQLEHRMSLLFSRQLVFDRHSEDHSEETIAGKKRIEERLRPMQSADADTGENSLDVTVQNHPGAPVEFAESDSHVKPLEVRHHQQ